jgi:hypothetical protein
MQKVRNNEILGNAIPDGYKRTGHGKNLIVTIDEERADVIRRIFDMYLGRNGTPPQSLNNIAVTLSREGVPVSGRFHSKGGDWVGQTIRRIISCRAYMGEFVYSGETVTKSELAIIDRGLWEEAQVLRERNAILNKRSRKFSYLLSSYIFCTCGRRLQGRATHGHSGIYHYYSCYAHKQLNYLPDKKCPEKGVRVDIADALVWEWISNLLTDAENLEAGIRKMNEKNKTGLAAKLSRLETVDRLLADADRKLQRLGVGYAEANDDLVANTLIAQMREISKQRGELAREHDLLDAQIHSSSFGEEEAENIRRVAVILKERLDGANYDTKRYIMEKLNVNVQLQHENGQRYLFVTCVLSTNGVLLSVSDLRSSSLISNPIQFYFEVRILLDA